MKQKIVLRSDIKFSLSIAKRFSPIGYYRAMSYEIKNLPNKEKEKAKVYTGKNSKITALIQRYKLLLHKKGASVFKVIAGIYRRNKQLAEAGAPPPIHTNIMPLLCNIPLLLLGYRSIRPNKGATTIASFLNNKTLKRLTPLQRRFLSRTATAPDGITYDIFKTAVTLLKQGKYPWGASRRIYIEKPGKPGELRPITIPPFMDRIIQASILRILEAIYEPWFERTNRSFGFRPNKGVHDAITGLATAKNNGLDIAIEGDIKGAYNYVSKTKLIDILSKRINDRRFLGVIKNRLDYVYYDSSKRRFIEEDQGIPQGGIDSPYLWNIYFQPFDE